MYIKGIIALPAVKSFSSLERNKDLRYGAIVAQVLFFSLVANALLFHNQPNGNSRRAKCRKEG